MAASCCICLIIVALVSDEEVKSSELLMESMVAEIGRDQARKSKGGFRKPSRQLYRGLELSL